MREFELYHYIAMLPWKFGKMMQNGLLREHLSYAAEKSSFYKRLFQASNIDPAKITVDTLKNVPFTTKDDLAQHPNDFYAVGMDKVADVVFSSGTTGTPTKIIYTSQDLHRLTYNEHKAMMSCGVTKSDIVLLTCTMDRCFIAGLAYYAGVQSIGACAIRNGLSSLESHFDVIKRTEPTVIIGVPSFLRKLGEYCKDKGVYSNRVKKLICIGEPIRNERLDMLQIGKDLVDLWPAAKLFSTYSSSETITTFCECAQKRGGHLQPDLAVVEIVDDSGNLVAAGESGEVVVTPLAIEGMPLIRFKTGDVSFLIEGDCGCGRKSPRLGPIMGRKQQMMKIKGTTVYPQAVYCALEETKSVRDYYIEVSADSELSDILTVHVAVDTGVIVDVIKDVLQAKLRVVPEIVIEDEKKIREKVYDPASRKPIRFFDKRIK
jgi:phenylacetate-CoA ligase